MTRHLPTPTTARRLLALVLLVVLGLGMVPVSRATAAAPSAPAAPAASEAQSTTPDISETNPLIFSDDFEAYGDSSLWSKQHAFHVQTDVVADGLFSARLTNKGGAPVYGIKTLDQTYSRFFIRMRVQILDVGDRPVTLLNLRPSPNRSFLALRVEPGGQLSFETGATGITSTSTAALEMDTWHDIQIFADNTTDNPRVRVWVDQMEMTSMRQHAWLGDGGMKIIQIGDNTAGRRFDIAFDDIRVDENFIPANRPADPVSGTLTVRAIPAWAGITYTLDGETFVSNDEGVVRIKVKRWSTDLRRRIEVHEAFNASGSKATFSQWRGWISERTRDVYATFRVSDPVTFSFVDMQGHPVENSSIDSLVIKSTTGDIVTLTGDQLKAPVLLTSTVITTPEGLFNKPITYVVDQVIIDGANVVHRAQQRTTFESTRHWQISLLFYGVKFRASDAFFGSPLGKEIVIEAADGSTQQLNLDAHGEVVVPRLPRGEYQVSVVGAGYSPPRPIMVSRDQIVDLEVISHLDIALVLSMGVLAVSGLLIIGRPFLILTPFRVLKGLATSLVALRSRETTT